MTLLSLLTNTKIQVVIISLGFLSFISYQQIKINSLTEITNLQKSIILEKELNELRLTETLSNQNRAIEELKNAKTDADKKAKETETKLVKLKESQMKELNALKASFNKKTITDCPSAIEALKSYGTQKKINK